MTTTNPLDVTYLFPFPGELAARLMQPAQASASSEAVGSVTAAQPTEAKRRTGAEQLAASMQQLNDHLHSFGIHFEFREPGNHLVTQVVDRETGDVIRQIPSEEMLRMTQHTESLQGLLINDKA